MNKRHLITLIAAGVAMTTTLFAAPKQSPAEDWCYIRYEDGSEELYDRKADPREWVNLAEKPEYVRIKRSLSQQTAK